VAGLSREALAELVADPGRAGKVRTIAWPSPESVTLGGFRKKSTQGSSPAGHHGDGSPSRDGCAPSRNAAPGHAIGRSRGGPTTKIYALADGRVLVALLTGGNVHDSTMFAPLLTALRVARPGPGRPRTRPDHLLAGKGYSSKGNRRLLRAREIAHTIPEKGDQAARRRHKGAAGGRPPGLEDVIRPPQLAVFCPQPAQLSGPLAGSAGTFTGVDLGPADHLRTVSVDPMPSFCATERIASPSVAWSARNSTTRRIARSRGYRVVGSAATPSSSGTGVSGLAEAAQS
jgi:DDE family transposase